MARWLFFRYESQSLSPLYALRAAGHHASARNAQFFNPAQPEPCDAVLIGEVKNAAEIAEAYRAKEIPVSLVNAQPEPESEVIHEQGNEETEEETQKEDVEASVLVLVEDGKTDQEIAAALGISRQKAWGVRRKHSK